MSQPKRQRYVSRGGEKLASALAHFQIDPSGWSCADLGSHVGGFVDCLLQHGADRVFAVDTAYGTLAWKLRRDPRVTVLERTNAMHVALETPVDLVTVDAGWTRQGKVLPNVVQMLNSSGRVITLIKPHYETEETRSTKARRREPKAEVTPDLVGGVLTDQAFQIVVDKVLDEIRSQGWTVEDAVPSPIRGHGGNREMFALLTRPS